MPTLAYIDFRIISRGNLLACLYRTYSGEAALQLTIGLVAIAQPMTKPFCPHSRL
jgi:hypothetical protein